MGGGLALVKVGAAEEVAAGFADEFAAAVLEAGGAGGAEDGVVLAGGYGALGDGGLGWCGFGDGFGGAGLHFDSVAQFAIFSTAVAGWNASNDVRFDSR
ncbi:hypothetical protein EDE15_2369 [Edaphobacter aggregans]|uniref:Uncharacterized protein n=1 Tax=Edaphobacter aggregans TaxID=570835 RepID=A0A3R9NU32_9BACT|nr:hypothetical protein EDE15_2369 [Edaphobacter aggregans]